MILSEFSPGLSFLHCGGVGGRGKGSYLISKQYGFFALYIISTTLSPGTNRFKSCKTIILAP